MKLNELSPAEGSTKQRMRIGRGVGSGKGKTGGRGVKGQKARSGVAINGFEGGQMPIYMRLPKRGFTPRGQKTTSWVNLGRVAKAVEAGKLDPSNVTEETLVASGLVRNVRDGVRLLAKGDAPKNLNITVTGASKAAIEAVEKAGGKVTVTGAAKDTAAE
ncbi:MULTISPECIES: 50S ribosomal protein L15 [Hyphomonas]|uniref:Large ribosomal subunit protein uL15 n=2 Tax=Hyphomonas adhaerens TaxID=81029 RepID=A0A069E1A7_9PROT|nr:MULTISPECIES: 50S ribosomal protein L15 [Hyphomonas]KCZ83260.1 50S ribosomal protein L15 [Hyphomonas adhaerens MHS-3]MBB40561.1 50S ribosomal protein L15 [Hyphomonas sp.]HAE25549.1 50S ribosomal protein L15 [Hyphomonas adhaerens]|tara:strand:+ start:272 stop:751 length:480 start_codon:yes stop_codon:yes gene_type:complete